MIRILIINLIIYLKISFGEDFFNILTFEYNWKEEIKKHHFIKCLAKVDVIDNNNKWKDNKQ
jgi:hypothetical protein